MALGLTDDKHYRNIAETLRRFNRDYENVTFKPEDMPQSIYRLLSEAELNGYNEGYEAGKAEGGDTDAAYQEGLSAGIEQGKQAEYDRFWDEFQQNGKRTRYEYAFAGWRGIPDIKYPLEGKLTPTNAYANYMFAYFNFATLWAERSDLTELCKRLDFSKLTKANYLFNNARAKNITVDLSNCTEALHTFNCNNGGGMDNLTIKVTEKLTSATSFFLFPGGDGATHFQTVRFTDDSVIAFSLTMQRLVSLSHDSICSVINALSPNTSGLSLSLSRQTVATAFGSTVEEIDKNEEWMALTATKTNWHIPLL